MKLPRNLARLARLAFWSAFAVASYFAIVPLPVPAADQPNDKIMHMLAFATLTGLGRLAFPRLGPWRLAVILSLYGVLIEVVQAIPALHRDSEFLDWAADTAAILVVLAAMTVAAAAWRLRKA